MTTYHCTPRLRYKKHRAHALRFMELRYHTAENTSVDHGTKCYHVNSPRKDSLKNQMSGSARMLEVNGSTSEKNEHDKKPTKQ
mmetsp:Transcript_75020/g.117393  ORF Transcript_75020/g.117393 Transcript_75020/m.117393 type:complete len:83 (-) Transcript_75020:291-539(-)